MFNIKYVINHKYIIWAQFAHDFIGFYTFCKRNLVAATRTGAAKEMSREKVVGRSYFLVHRILYVNKIHTYLML